MIAFGPSFCTIASTTCWSSSPAANACTPKPSGFLSYWRKVSSIAFEPLSSNGRNCSHAYCPSTAVAAAG